MEHGCIQQQNINRLENATIDLVKATASLDATVKAVNVNIERLDKRCNGTFKAIGDHINEAPTYREDIGKLKVEVKNMKEERLNTVKASQWRIGLIVGFIMGVVELAIRLFVK